MARALGLGHCHPQDAKLGASQAPGRAYPASHGPGAWLVLHSVYLSNSALAVSCVTSMRTSLEPGLGIPLVQEGLRASRGPSSWLGLTQRVFLQGHFLPLGLGQAHSDHPLGLEATEATSGLDYTSTGDVAFSCLSLVALNSSGHLEPN